MVLSRIFAIVLRQFYLIRGSFSRVLPLFIWAAVDIILWGFLTRYLNTSTTAGFDFVPAMLGAVLFWDFFIRIMQGVTMAFFEDVWSRNFLNIFSTPIKISEYLTGLIGSTMFTSIFGIVVMVLLATLVFGLSFLSYGIAVVPFVMILFIFAIALGIIACAIVLRLGPAAEWFIWPLPAMISPFVGVFYPVTVLPLWMQLVSRLLPPAYVFENLRAVVMHRAVSYGDLGAGLFLAMIYLIAAAKVFHKTYCHATNTGLIARYSAESLS